jgi:hypothetical protein
MYPRRTMRDATSPATDGTGAGSSVSHDLGAPLVDRATGAVRVGLYPGALDDPNIEDARFPHALSRLAGAGAAGRLEAAYRSRLRLKTWQYVSIVSPRWFVALVVGDAGFAGNGFFYAIDRQSGVVQRRFVISPLGRGMSMSPTSARGEHRFRGRDLAIEIDNLDGGRRFAIRIDGRFEATGARFGGAVELRSAPADEHVSLCVPLPTGRWNYTHKFGALRARGSIDLGDGVAAFDPATSFATLDFTRMIALRHAVWRWVALCGPSRQGPLVGINLVDPTPDAPVSENGLWIDGRFEPLTGVRLEPVDRDDAHAPWLLRAEGGRVDLGFRALAHVDQTLRLPLLRHRLRHVGGWFRGRVVTRSGRVLDLDDVFGIAEDNDTWW